MKPKIFRVRAQNVSFREQFVLTIKRGVSAWEKLQVQVPACDTQQK